MAHHPETRQKWRVLSFVGTLFWSEVERAETRRCDPTRSRKVPSAMNQVRIEGHEFDLQDLVDRGIFRPPRSKKAPSCQAVPDSSNRNQLR